MITPSRLRKNDKVAFVAPARKVTREELKQAESILLEWGLDIVYPEGLFKENNQFAGTDKERITHIQWCLDHPEIKAVFCVRGGYGTSRIVDALDFSKFIKSPKWMIGFSDVTVLLGQLYNLGVKSIHGPIALLLHQEKEVQEQLKRILFENKPKFTITVEFNELSQLGRVEGKLVGGNLSVLVNQIGTSSFPDLEGVVLFLEDLDEYLYHIDRMMINMKRNGKFNNLIGMIIGMMNDMNDNKIRFGKTAEEIILEHVREYSFPICFGFPSGHLDDNRSIKLGVSSVLDINENGVSLSQS